MTLELTFNRTWFAVNIPQFHTFVRNMLMPVERRLNWQGMKSQGQLRFENNVRAEHKKDSRYKQTTRKKFSFKALVVPNKLQAQLPYAAKPKYMPKSDKKGQKLAVIREPEEEQRSRVLQMVRAVHKERRRVDRTAMVERSLKHKKTIAKIEDKRNAKQKQIKKAVLGKLSRINKE